jgi:hypothetical protein
MDEKDGNISSSPWFMDKVELCKKQWYPSFDRSLNSLSLAPIWFRISNSITHLGHLSLEIVGNALGKFHHCSYETWRRVTQESMLKWTLKEVI